MSEDESPPEVSTREDCGNPHRCICHDDSPCQWPLLKGNMPVAREDLEMPERGM